MPAFIKENIENGFLLDEGHLAKLNDICKKRLSEKNIQSPLTYKVYRFDSLVYETSEYTDATDEENSKRNKIEKITIECKDDSLTLDLSFDSREGIRISIETESKDFAYLLFSDIKDYLKTEVAKYRNFSFRKVLNFKDSFPFLMLPFMAWMLYAVGQGHKSQDTFDAILSSSDATEKLNYLLEATRAQRDIGSAWKILVPTLLVAFFLKILGPLLDRYYPINVFCWGKAEIDYRNLISIRGKFVWGVIIAFMISAIASLFINFVTK